MHIHISAVCGTFMGGVARLAKELGHKVTGSDANVYPPMSDQLRDAGVELMEGFSAENLKIRPDLVVIGNALSRGNSEVEAVLGQGIPYMSGAQWLSEFVLQDRWVLAVAGTHGKTTCSSLLAWVLEDAGMSPGFLIGGVPGNFNTSARLGDSPFFVVEADEYDTAFFDKRSKFVHYRPRTLVLNNLEFDHADIFPNLDAIKTQFHHLIRTVPSNGLLVTNGDDKNLQDVLDTGHWTPVEYFSMREGSPDRWLASAKNLKLGTEFSCSSPEAHDYEISWPMSGPHSVMNAMAVIAAARHAGVPTTIALEGLKSFKGIKRRMEVRARHAGVTVYDDFAHHPTAINATLEGLRAQYPKQKIVAILEMRSNTMRMGYHKENVLIALKVADLAIIYSPEGSNVRHLEHGDVEQAFQSIELIPSIDAILDRIREEMVPESHIVIMSNGSFHGIHEKVTNMLQAL